MSRNSNAYLIYGYATKLTPAELIKKFGKKLKIDIKVEEKKLHHWWAYQDCAHKSDPGYELWKAVGERLKSTGCKFHHHIIYEECQDVILSAHIQGTYDFIHSPPNKMKFPTNTDVLDERLEEAAKAIGWPKSKPGYYMTTTYQ